MKRNDFYYCSACKLVWIDKTCNQCGRTVNRSKQYSLKLVFIKDATGVRYNILRL